jgi:PAS domain S-box-containing protein
MVLEASAMQGGSDRPRKRRFPRFRAWFAPIARLGRMSGRGAAGPVAAPPIEVTGLSARLQELTPEILADWEREVRALPAARGLARPLLVDHMPDLLVQITQMASALAQNRIPRPPEHTVDLHAIERLSVGFDLREVVAEYAVLRATITRHLYQMQSASDLPLALAILDQAIDASIAASVDRFTSAQERTLKALDRIATASLESKSLDELLHRLLRIFLEVADAVDTAVILLREGDVLRVRAAVGLEEELLLGFSMRIGEGFAGTVAATKKPLCLRSAGTDPLVRSPVIHDKCIKALWGVPLVQHGRVIGVAHMGSLTSEEFSVQDQRLFAALASRATAGICQHLLMQNLDAERQRYGDLVNHLDHAVIWEADAETFAFTFVSDMAAAMTGFSPEEWMRAKDFWAEHVPPEDLEKLRAVFRRCQEESADGRLDHRFLTRDGKLVWMQTSVRFSRRDGQAVFNGLSLDITQMKNALLSRDWILAVVTHDLRNPLGAILMNADLLARESPPGGALPPHVQQQRAAIIVRSSQRMSRMISDLVDLSSIEAGRLSVVGQPEDPCKLVQEAVTSFERLAREKGVTLRQEAPAALPRVNCDRDRVQQIFSNLITNALNVTRRGGSIVIGAEARTEEVVFSVADTGPGIAAEDIPNLFEPYWRGDANRYKGTGLGLAIVRGLLATHGGRIWVESEVSVGTTFFFTLPMENRAAGRPEAKAPREA